MTYYTPYSTLPRRSQKAAWAVVVWFVGVASGIYEARYPVWVREDRPDKLEFTLELPRSVRRGNLAAR